jgi:hypothetical protein
LLQPIREPAATVTPTLCLSVAGNGMLLMFAEPPMEITQNFDKHMGKLLEFFFTVFHV